MPATTPLPKPQNTSADVEANKLLARAANGKSGIPMTKSNGASAARVAGTKVSGKGATRTRGGSV